MKRSPLSTPAGQGWRRRTPYNWSPHENGNRRGYQSAKHDGYQRFNINNGRQSCGDDFIPLNISTPEPQYKKHSGNWYSSANKPNNTSTPNKAYNCTNNYYATARSSNNNPNNANRGSGGFNYRNNYVSPMSNCNNSYSPHKQFHGRKKNDKTAHKQVDISQYINLESIFEDPWADLIKKLDISKGTNTSAELLLVESSFNIELNDGSSTKRLENELSDSTNLNDLQCIQTSKIDSSTDVSIETENADISEISKSSTIDLPIDSINFSQDSLNQNTDQSISENNPRIIEKRNDVHLDESVTDIVEKDI